MPTKLAQATTAQRQAAWKVILPELETAIAQYVPPMFQYTVRNDLNRPDVQAKIFKAIDDGLDAALNA